MHIAVGWYGSVGIMQPLLELLVQLKGTIVLKLDAELSAVQQQEPVRAWLHA